MADYSVDALKNGIEQCRKNIQTFENAIQKERDTINEYHFMIDTILRKKREKEMVIKIEVEREDD